MNKRHLISFGFICFSLVILSSLVLISPAKSDEVELAGLPIELQHSLSKAYETKDAFVIRAVKERALRDYPQWGAAINYYISQGIEKAQVAKTEASENKAAQDASVESVNVAAKETVEPEKEASPWSGDVELGAQFATGNTETQHLNAAASLVYERDKWGHTSEVKIATTKEDGDRTREEYRVGHQVRYNLSSIDYAFGELDYVRDRFSGFEHRFSELLGYGRTLWASDGIVLKGEVGLGARQSIIEDEKDENSPLGKVGAKMKWDISDNMQLSEELSSSIGSDAIITEFDSALKTRMVDNLHLKFGVNMEHISDVPDGREKLDVVTTVNIVYDW